MVPGSNFTSFVLKFLASNRCKKVCLTLFFLLGLIKIEEVFDHLDVVYIFFNISSSHHQHNFGSTYYSSDQFNLQCNTEHLDNESNLKVIHLNMHAFSANGLDFKARLVMLKVEFDIVCVTETWLNIADETLNMFPGYTSYLSIRERRRGGGVSVFIKKQV